MSAVPSSPSHASVPSASRMSRLGAFALDLVILAFAQRLGAYLGGVMAAVIMTARGAPQAVLEQEIETGISFGASFWGLAFLAVNYGVLQGIWGGSAGKLICGLRVVNRDGTPIGLVKSLARTCCYVFSAAPMYAGFAMAFFDRKARALHDHLSGTIVAEQSMVRDTSLPAPMAIPVQPLPRMAGVTRIAPAAREDSSKRAA